MKARNILGLDIGGTKTAIIYGNEKGEIFERIAFPSEVKSGFKNSFKVLCIQLKIFLDRYKKKNIKFSCISVSIGGPLDIERGIIYSPPNLPGWDSIPLKKLLEKKFKLPVYVEHDGNAGALAEMHFGAGRGFKNIIFMTMGTGLGAGIILNGKVYRGTNDLAGEVGHIRLAENGPKAYGKYGSYESFCSGSGIRQLAKKMFPKKYSRNVTAKDIVDDLKNGDKDAVKVISVTAKYLGRGMAILVDILNPEIIIIGSMAVRLGDKLLKPAIKEMKKESLQRSFSVCQVKPSGLGDKIGDYASLCAGIANLNKK